MFKKYWYTFKNSIFQVLEYRSDYLLGFFINVIPVASLVFLWLNVYSQGKQLGAYSLSSLLTYYLAGILFSFLLINDARWTIERHIRSGFLSVYLIKPQNYLFSIFWFVFARLFLNMLIVSFIFLISRFFFPKFFLLPANFWQAVAFLFALALAFILNFIISSLFGLLAFWMKTISGLYYVFNMIYSFLAGFYLPLDTLPLFWQNLVSYLPFSYMFYFPLKIFLGQASANFILKGFIIQIVWLLLLFYSLKKIWRLGIKEYEAVGT